MPKKSNNYAEKILHVGIELVAKKGSKVLSVREVCRTANVNLGLFVYYFQNKENYIKEIFREIGKRMVEFSYRGITGEMEPFEKLKHYYKQVCLFTNQNKNLVRMVFIECAIDKELYIKYLENGTIRHSKETFDIVEEAKRSGCLKENISSFDVHYAIFYNILLPILFSESAVLLTHDGNVPEIKFETYINKLNRLLDSMHK